MMKEWAAARQRVQDMKSTDAKAAEKLNKEITIRYELFIGHAYKKRKQLYRFAWNMGVKKLGITLEVNVSRGNCMIFLEKATPIM